MKGRGVRSRWPSCINWIALELLQVLTHSLFLSLFVSPSQADYQRLVEEKAALLDARAVARKEASAKKTAEKVPRIFPNVSLNALQ